MSCVQELVHSVARAHCFGTSKIKYYVSRVLDQIHYNASLCAQERMSSDILHKEFGVIIVWATRAAQKAAHTAPEVFS